MEWLALAVSVLGAAVSVVAAYRSEQSARRAMSAVRTRADARAAVAGAMDAGNRLLEEMRAERSRGESVGEHDRRLQVWEAVAHKAVESADAAQLPRFHAPVGHLTPLHTLEERIRRLQVIQDSL
jgi:hypothetical protein